MPASYWITRVQGTPFGGRANTVNDAGLVGGSELTADPPSPLNPSQAFLWQDGAIVWQGSLGIPAAGVVEVNDAGDAVINTASPEAPYGGEFAGAFCAADGSISTLPAPALVGTS